MVLVLVLEKRNSILRCLNSQFYPFFFLLGHPCRVVQQAWAVCVASLVINSATGVSSARNTTNRTPTFGRDVIVGTTKGRRHAPLEAKFH